MAETKRKSTNNSFTEVGKQQFHLLDKSRGVFLFDNKARLARPGHHGENLLPLNGGNGGNNVVHPGQATTAGSAHGALRTDGWIFSRDKTIVLSALYYIGFHELPKVW